MNTVQSKISSNATRIAKHSVSAVGAMLLAGVLSANTWAETDRAGDFALIDSNGKIHQLSRYRHKKALVVMAQDSKCDSSKNAKALSKLAKKHDDFGFTFMQAGAKQDMTPVADDALPVMLDESQLVTETLHLTHDGQVAVLDPNDFRVLYRGPAGKELNAALKSIEKGETPAVVEVATSGCEIAFPVKMAHAENVPDYVKDIVPIIKENCADCHREGGIGPFAMNSYMMLKGWSPMIREVLLTKRMPPMQVDPHVNSFSNALYMSNEDMQTLVHWIDAGAPKKASDADPLEKLELVDLRAWQLGEPDYVVKLPKHDVPATGVMDYINTDIALNLDKDVWVKAVQFIPGDPAVLHHLLTYVRPNNGEFDGGEGGRGLNSGKFLEGYAPGKVDSMSFPEGTGVYIPKGHVLSMQFHYTTNGKATSDETLLGLYFHEKPPKYEYLNRAVLGPFTIPPHALEEKATASYVFPEDVVVHGLRAHMHYRGRYMDFTAIYPDGTEKKLLNVPNYSYAWQPTFQMEEPMLLPKGTKVVINGAFDNSEYNPANPDPSKEVGFGLQSWDEMFIGYFSYHTAKASNPE